MTDHESMLGPERALAFDFDEFAYYFEIAFAAGALKMPVENPEQYGLDIEMEPGHVERIQFTDNSLNRTMLALQKEIDDPGKFVSFSYRFFALMDMIRNEALSRWVRRDETESRWKEVHPALIDVARRIKMNKKGKFSVRAFRRAVERSRVTAEEDAT